MKIKVFSEDSNNKLLNGVVRKSFSIGSFPRISDHPAPCSFCTWSSWLIISPSNLATVISAFGTYHQNYHTTSWEGFLFSICLVSILLQSCFTYSGICFLNQMLNELPLGNRQLRVFYGSTKFCPHFLKQHPCHLPHCNYAHYYSPELTHYKNQAKQINHINIAYFILKQQPNIMAHFQYLSQIFTQGRTLFLHLTEPQFKNILDNMKQQSIQQISLQQIPSQVQEQNNQKDKDQQWGKLQKEISQTSSEIDKNDKQQVETSPKVQHFLDAAQRFLTKLIFESSVFVC